MPQPDFVITVNGQDGTGYCQEWRFRDDEEAQAEIEVTLANPDMRLSGKFDYGDDLQIRFGNIGDLSGIAYLPVAKVKEVYPTGNDLTVVLTGRDESQKLSGGKKKGNKGTNKKDQEIIHKLAEEDGMRVASEQAGQGTTHKKAYVMNENTNEAAIKFGRNIKPQQSAGDSGGSKPKSPFGSKDGKHLFSAAGRIPEGGDDRDEHQGDNHSNTHRNEPIKGKLKLIGYPLLRAKATVMMVDYGPKASGLYYVKSVDQRWSVSGGYTTEADLIRCGTGKGGAGDTPPMVMYADEFKKGEMYLGPRKMNQAPQATFSRLDRTHAIDFEYELDPQLNRHAGEGSEGKGIDLRDKGNVYKAGEAAGGQAAAAAGGGN